VLRSAGGTQAAKITFIDEDKQPFLKGITIKIRYKIRRIIKT
jgi:hypothetical protein